MRLIRIATQNVGQRLFVLGFALLRRRLVGDDALGRGLPSRSRALALTALVMENFFAAFFLAATLTSVPFRSDHTFASPLTA